MVLANNVGLMPEPLTLWNTTTRAVNYQKNVCVFSEVNAGVIQP